MQDLLDDGAVFLFLCIHKNIYSIFRHNSQLTKPNSCATMVSLQKNGCSEMRLKIMEEKKMYAEELIGDIVEDMAEDEFTRFLCWLSAFAQEAESGHQAPDLIIR